MTDRKHIQEEEIALHKQLAGEYVKRRTGEGSRLFDDYWNDEVLKCLEGCARDTVLDACCGDGILIPALAKAFASVTGVDISEDMLALARSRMAESPIPLVQGEIEALPFDDAAFDAVTFRGAFHHVSDPLQSMREVARVLRPGGRVVFFEPNGDPWIWRTFRQCYYALSGRFSSGHRSYRRRELCDLVEAAGLDVVDAKFLFYFAYPFAGLTDHFPVLRRVPFHTACTRGLLAIDRVMARIPLLRRLGFALVVVGGKATPA